MHAISILIPVYNWHVGRFIAELHRQCSAEVGLTFEICCYDDASPDVTIQRDNLALSSKLAGVRYAVLPQNVGRAAIRNRLAADAQHPWLLFLDGDSGLPDDHFIQRYRQATQEYPASSVWVGGTLYEATPPSQAALRLRWAYGRAREQRAAQQRRKTPYAAFTLNNLLIRAALYRRFGLDESLGRTYGHEDTALGGLLATHQINIDHLDNPVLHLGLEPAEAFLAKTREAVVNLVTLAQRGIAGPSQSSLWLLANRLQRLKVAPMVRYLLSASENRLLHNLKTPSPAVWCFDVWRLLLVLRAMK
jgi:glycosyltransferase involved in cell wall biosynthesis